MLAVRLLGWLLLVAKLLLLADKPNGWLELAAGLLPETRQLLLLAADTAAIDLVNGGADNALKKIHLQVIN